MRNNVFRSVLQAASIVFLMSLMAPPYDFGIQFQSAMATRSFDVDRSGDSRSGEGTNDSETSEERGNGFFANASTLEEVWSDLKRLVPNRGTDGYIQPEPIVVEDFERIVLDMLTAGHTCFERVEKDDENVHGHESCRLGRTPPSSPCDLIDLRSLKGMYRIGTFTDQENWRSYCILATTSIDYPWGNVVVDLDASSVTKNLSFDCPHPKFDAETGEQGIRMLKGTTARSWIVAGSHRMANNRTLGTCQPQYSHYPSDVAHSDDNCFLAAVAAVKYYYESIVRQDYTSVQLHGMGKTSCGSIDTFFSHGACSETVPFENGNRPKPNPNHPNTNSNAEKIDIIQRIAQAYPFDNGRHVVAGRDGGNGLCKLCGSTNIQGRLINGVARKDLCNTYAPSYNGRFIQIEQKRDYRRESFARFWNDVFNEAYPKFSVLATMPNAEEQLANNNGNSKSLDND